MDHYLKLPLFFDVNRLEEDLSTSEKYFWANHYNTRDYSGTWKGISLRSVNGRSENIISTEEQIYQGTPLLSECPYFTCILDNLHCPLETVRLLALEPGSEIKTHRDRGLSYAEGCFRLHIPIITDPDVEFVVGDVRLDMKPGECWYANFDLPHSVKHNGMQRRIHLVIDGKRNDWTDELFANAGFNTTEAKPKPKYDVHTLSEMIKHLEAMGTETADRMIVALKAQHGSVS